MFKEAIISIAWTDCLVVLDASMDQSVSECAKGIRPDAVCIVDGDPDMRMRLHRNRNAVKCDYILAICSDEIWSGPVAEEIRQVLSEANPPEGLIVEHESFNFGTSFGVGWPQIRVFKRDAFRFLTDDIHEMASVPGPTRVLKKHYLHYPNHNMLINWVKNYKYMITQSAIQDAQTPDPALANLRLTWLARYVARLNYRLIKSMWRNRRHGFAGLCMAHRDLICLIVRELVPEEARRIRVAGQVYETAGHINMP